MPRRKRSIKKLLRRIIPAALLGILVGVPLSYDFQGPVVHAFVTRGQYTREVFAAAPAAIWRQVNSAGGSVDPFNVAARLSAVVMITTGASVMIGLWLSGKRRR